MHHGTRKSRQSQRIVKGKSAWPQKTLIRYSAGSSHAIKHLPINPASGSDISILPNPRDTHTYTHYFISAISIFGCEYIMWVRFMVTCEMVKLLMVILFSSPSPSSSNTQISSGAQPSAHYCSGLWGCRKTPCLSNHTWHFAPGDYQFEVGFLPFLWPNAATKMQKIALREWLFVRVASGVYFEHAKPCNHDQVPISNTAGWIPLFFLPSHEFEDDVQRVCMENDNDVSKCGRHWLLASLFQLRSPLQAGA